MDSQKLYNMYMSLPAERKTRELYRLTGWYELCVDEGSTEAANKAELAFVALADASVVDGWLSDE